jgi:hypothetical protein
MSDEIQKLRQEVAELREELERADDWSSGVLSALMTILPFLLRDHPRAEQVRDLLKSKADRYEQLERGVDDESQDELSLAAYEPAKMLYHLLALHGVWPGVDPLETAKASVERYQRR